MKMLLFIVMLSLSWLMWILLLLTLKPSGTDSDNWSIFLFRYGIHSQAVREALAASASEHANEIVEWDEGFVEDTMRCYV